MACQGKGAELCLLGTDRWLDRVALPGGVQWPCLDQVNQDSVADYESLFGRDRQRLVP